MALPAGKILVAVSREAATKEGRERIAIGISMLFFLFLLITSIPVLLIETGIDKLTEFYGLSEEEAAEWEEEREKWKEFFPEEYEDEENIGFYGKYPMPLSGKVRVTSEFGYRTDPIDGRKKLHSGIDLASNIPSGGNVIAIASGKVIRSLPPHRSHGYGNMILIYHEEEDFYTLSAHLKERKVFEGDTVEQYQVIGIEGATGRVTGRHLHFEVRLKAAKDSAVNPRKYLYEEE